jgi:predicted esterase
MEFATAQELQTRVREHYARGEYLEGLALLDAHAAAFPEQAEVFANYGACLAALAGDPGRALDILEEAAAAGVCFPAALLREDPDLASLKDKPRFRAALIQLNANFRQAQAGAFPTRDVLPPAADTPKPFPAVLHLHGRRSSTALERSAWEGVAADGVLVALAQSSQAIGEGVYAWDDPEQAAVEVAEHWGELAAVFPLDPARRYLSGFSQGGGTAIRLALAPAAAGSSDAGVRGVIALGPWLPDPRYLGDLLAGTDHRRPPVYLVSGANDPEEDVFAAIAAMLERLGAPVRRETLPGIGHGYPPAAEWAEVVRRALAWIG